MVKALLGAGGTYSLAIGLHFVSLRDATFCIKGRCDQMGLRSSGTFLRLVQPLTALFSSPTESALPRHTQSPSYGTWLGNWTHPTSRSCCG
jgi:hypothetical protein